MARVNVYIDGLNLYYVALRHTPYGGWIWGIGPEAS